jgi:hypothetical protein
VKCLLARTFLLLCVTSTAVKAEDSDTMLHGAAHAGASYAITHGTQALCVSASDLGKAGCTAIGIATALAAGIAKEVSDGNNANQDHGKGMMFNAFGIAGATLMINLKF